MFAIIQTGGKQYKVTEGQTLDVEKLNRAVGDKVEFDVLLVSDGDNTKSGSPKLNDVTKQKRTKERNKDIDNHLLVLKSQALSN